MERGALEQAFLSHRRRVDAMVATARWERFGDEFTEHAVYRRPGLPTIQGRAAIAAWAVESMSGFPADQIASFAVAWYSLDPPSSTVTYESRATMRDPGDGSVHAASTITTLGYGEAGLWAWGMDVSQARVWDDMFGSWIRVARRHGLELPVGSPA